MGILLTVLGAVALLACLISPVAGTCAYIMTIIIRPNDVFDGVMMPIVPLMLIMFALAYALHVGRALPPPPGKPSLTPSLLVGMYVLVLLHFFVFPSGWPVKDWILADAAPAILLLVYMTRHMARPKMLQAGLTSIGAGASVIALDAFYVHFYHKLPRRLSYDSDGYPYWGHGKLWDMYHLRGERLMGKNSAMWGNANDFGMLVNWALLTCLFYVKRKGSKIVKLMFAGLAGVLAVTLILTGSRGGQLQLAINLWMVFVGGKRKVLGLFLLSTALVGALVVLPRLSPQRADAGASKDERTELVMAAYRLFKMYPIQGAGFRRFPQLNDFRSLFPHNVYAQCLAETGIVGGALFFPLVFLLRRETGQAAKHFIKHGTPNEAALAQSINALHASFSVFILFSNQFMTFAFSLIMTLAMAVRRWQMVDMEKRGMLVDEDDQETPPPDAAKSDAKPRRPAPPRRRFPRQPPPV